MNKIPFNNFLPKKCKTCGYLDFDYEEMKYACNDKEEYLTYELAKKCVKKGT